MPTHRRRPCLSLIQRFARCIRVPVHHYLFSGIVLAGKKVLADKAYSCEKIRNQLEKQGAVLCIPDKSNSKMKHSFDAELYKRRNLVERFFQRVKNFRHIAFRFDKLADCFLNFVLLASSVIPF